MATIKTKKPLVFVDLDGVVADFVGPLIKKGFPYPQDYHFGNYSEEDRKYVNSLFRDPDFYLQLEPMPGAQEALMSMIELNVFGGFLTARPHSVLEATMRWVGRHFPFVFLTSPQPVINHPDKAGFVREAASLYGGDIRVVEDAPHHASGIAKAGGLVYLVDHPYNRNSDYPAGVLRVEGIEEAVDHLRSEVLAFQE